MEKKPYEKWWLWILAGLAFLVIVQILFTIEAPCKWLEAKWGAGDLISFVGTIVLGFIAIRQTQYANGLSYKLMEMQRNEYRPLLKITGMVGITKHQFYPASGGYDGKIGLTEMRDDENEVYLGYSMALQDDGFDKSKKIFCRSYEVRCKYTGKINIKSLSLKTLKIEGDSFSREFLIDGDNLMSLGDEEEISLFFFLVSNFDFTDESSNSYQLISAYKLVLSMTMETYDGKIYSEDAVLVKHLVKEPEKYFNTKNIEMLVSVSYDVKDPTM